ncbi:MAG: hypothetical protein AB7F09_11175 [Parvibaculaceae bacterium]
MGVSTRQQARRAGLFSRTAIAALLLGAAGGISPSLAQDANNGPPVTAAPADADGADDTSYGGIDNPGGDVAVPPIPPLVGEDATGAAASGGAATGGGASNGVQGPSPGTNGTRGGDSNGTGGVGLASSGTGGDAQGFDIILRNAITPITIEATGGDGTGGGSATGGKGAGGSGGVGGNGRDAVDPVNVNGDDFVAGTGGNGGPGGSAIGTGGAGGAGGTGTGGTVGTMGILLGVDAQGAITVTSTGG